MPTVRNKDMGSWDMSLNEGMNETFTERYIFFISNTYIEHMVLIKNTWKLYLISSRSIVACFEVQNLINIV